jgi:hypothetical protein
MRHQDPYQRARSAFAVAHMSNAKWRKVLHALATADFGLTRSEWKCIDSDHVLVHGIPRLTDILETRFADGQFQPFEYKWVEWVRFPRTYRSYKGEVYEVRQDVERLTVQRYAFPKGPWDGRLRNLDIRTVSIQAPATPALTASVALYY